MRNALRAINLSSIMVAMVGLLSAGLAPAWSCCDRWDTYTPISKTGVSITEPTGGLGYACNSEVTCTVAGTPTDEDRLWHWRTDTYTYHDDTFNKEGAYRWECQYGSWKNGDDTGRSVTWIAPNGPHQSCWIRCYLCDDAEHTDEGQCPSRNDEVDPYVEVTVKVYTIACVKIEATNDQNIYWPDPLPDDEGNVSDVIWKANKATYEATGNIVETCTRLTAADKFASSGSYNLTLELARYPSCSTEQTPSTEWGSLGESQDGWSPAAFTESCQPRVGWQEYAADLTFKVTNRLCASQMMGWIYEYDIFGDFACPQQEFTAAHLDDAVGWGSGQSIEPAIAEQVCDSINGDISSSGCVCDTDSFQQLWEGAAGLNNHGMCCCRAKGMVEVLQVLGLGTYVQDYVNERPEPNAKMIDTATCATCGFCRRQAWGGGILNGWQGVCKKQNGATCYSPQGPHVAVYETMNDAPSYPQPGQMADRSHAFDFYVWVWIDQFNDAHACQHMGPPR